jgi:HPr kinase/phosphorylase
LIVHGTAVAVGHNGLLILGTSGAGKSGLALRMIALGADLVSDDRVDLSRETDAAGAALVARAPVALRGLIEARGIGLLRLEARASVRLKLAVDLDRPPAARMPQGDTITYQDVALRLISGRDVPNIDAILTLLLQGGRADLE